jgi:hypothetical protein
MRTGFAAFCLVISALLAAPAFAADDSTKDRLSSSASTSTSASSSVRRMGDADAHADRVEQRIRDLHARLQITAAQESDWSDVAQAMRDNAQQMDTLSKTRAERSNMSAPEDLDSFAEIADAHAAGIRKFIPAFKKLYASMSDAQKRNADEIFRHGPRHGAHAHG